MERPGKPRILVIDDREDTLERTLQAIRNALRHYEARIARGPWDGIDYLLGGGRFHERLRHPLPDLVLLKMAMTPIDGAEVLRQVKPYEQLRRIPIVLLCENEDERSRAMAREARASGYVVMPLSSGGISGLLDRFAPPAPPPAPAPPSYAAMRFV
jgi:CheY-like chemotaxis protein